MINNYKNKNITFWLYTMYLKLKRQFFFYLIKTKQFLLIERLTFLKFEIDRTYILEK